VKHLKLYGSVALCLVIVVSLSVVGLSAFADSEPTPAEVKAAEQWLDENTPAIKEAQKKLDTLRSEQTKRVKVLEAFGYDYNWDTLELVKVPKG
jgi:hypothetical protein